jgi:hypothetical protein
MEKSANTLPEPQISGLRDQAVVQEARQFGAFANTYRKSLQTVNCVVVDAAWIEPVRLKR